jgi:hypothetical protein
MTAEMGLPAPSTASENPSNAPDKSLPERTRIPMSLPTQKLAVPEIPGYHCHWMRGDHQRINQALRAGYIFVDPGEVSLNDFGLANGPSDDGNHDLGSRVSHIAGTAADGKAETLYLMKLPLALWEQDQAALGQRQEQIASSIRGEKGFAEGGMDTSNRYAGAQSNKNQNIFIPKRSS